MGLEGWVKAKFYLEKGADTKHGHLLWGAECETQERQCIAASMWQLFDLSLGGMDTS